MKKIILTVLLVSTTVLLIRGQFHNYYEIAQSNIEKYNPPRKDYVIIINYKKSILEERLHIIDMKTKNIVLSSKVSHAFKSGLLYATNFSNKNRSNKSSKGTYITGGTKYGKFGYSMYVNGKDKGVNDNALNRSIIFHSDRLMSTKWSKGCFATPEKINKKIINLTKNGCLVVVID